MADPIKLEGVITSEGYGTDAPPVNDAPPPPSNDAPPPPSNDAPPAPAVTSWDERWKQEFGDTPVDAVKQKYSQFDTVDAEYKKVLPDYQKIKADYESLPDEAKYIADLRKKGVSLTLEEIGRYSSIDPEKLDADTAIKLAGKLQNKGWEDKHAEADFNAKYSYNPDDIEVTDEQKLLKDGAKIVAANQAKEFLKGFIGKQFTPAAIVQPGVEDAALTKAKTDFWTGNAGSISTKVKEVPLTGTYKTLGEKGEEEKTFNYKHILPDESLKGLTDYALQSAIANGVPLNEQGIAQVQTFATELVWAKQGPQILQTALKEQSEQMLADFRKVINNPTITNGGGGVAADKGDINSAYLEAEIKRSQRQPTG